MSNWAKRHPILKTVKNDKPNVSQWGYARQVIEINQGLEQTIAKQITGFIRERKFKVTTQIQGEEICVSGKSRDDLQAVIAAVRGGEFPAALQFQNFRD